MREEVGWVREEVGCEMWMGKGELEQRRGRDGGRRGQIYSRRERGRGPRADGVLPQALVTLRVSHEFVQAGQTDMPRSLLR